MSKRRALVDAYNKYYALVYSELYAKISDVHIAEDLSHEIFIIMFEKFDTIENIRKWIYGAIKNTLRSYYRKNDIKILDLDNVCSDKKLEFSNGMKDSRILLEHIINNLDLDDTEKIIFDMLARYNRNNKETAICVSMSIRQVRYIYLKIRQKILYELQKKGIESIEALL